MSRKPIEPYSSTVEALLASARTLRPQSDRVRRRALSRARAATSAGAAAPGLSSGFRGRTSLRWAVAAVVAAMGTVAAVAAISPRHDAKRDVVEPAPPLAAQIRVSRPLVTSVPSGDSSDHGDLGPKVQARPRPSPVASARSAREHYALELKVLEPARAALASRDFSTALSAIAEHERRFPEGELTEEREALRVQSLSGLHRSDEASRAAAAFRRRFPGSVLLERIEHSLQPSP
jgi:hypothetical protein